MRTDRDNPYPDINGPVTEKVLALFRSKQSDHPGEGHFMLLGARGQFAELNKKFWKLYHAVWRGDIDLIGEDVEEVASDMVGHLLLMIWCLQNEPEEAKEDGDEYGPPKDDEPWTSGLDRSEPVVRMRFETSNGAEFSAMPGERIPDGSVYLGPVNE